MLWIVMWISVFPWWSVKSHVTSKWFKTPRLRIAVLENPFPKVHPRYSGLDVSFHCVCVFERNGPAYSLLPHDQEKSWRKRRRRRKIRKRRKKKEGRKRKRNRKQRRRNKKRRGKKREEEEGDKEPNKISNEEAASGRGLLWVEGKWVYLK